MSDWRTVTSCATERDDCAKCRHSAMSQAGDVRLCTHPEVRARYRRLVIAASVAMADGCRGRYWSRADASRTRQNGVKTGDRTELVSAQPPGVGDALDGA